MSAHLTVLPAATERTIARQCAELPAAFSVVAAESEGHSELRNLAPEEDPQYGRLSAKAKDKFLVKRGAMAMLDRARNKTAAAAILESQLAMQMGRGFSAKRLINDYYVWIGANRDWRLLVDAALAPGFRLIKRAHGAPVGPAGDGCAVPYETAEWWITLAESFQRNSLAGWREAQRLWIKSWADPKTTIPGYGSARDYWARQNPFLLKLTTCPPDFPRGWTRSTFYAKMPPEWESANARVGSAYARNLLPGVPATRKGARYLEWVFFDDKWHDFFVVVDGQLQPCRLLELGALDYATGEYIVWGFRPELEGDDNTKVRLKEQDMKWLVAALFGQEGYPRDYDCHLVCERGTAVLREGPARALFDLSGGRIKTCYTEMQGSTWLIWEEKKKGNSRGKAPLESLHNYLKNESGNLPGQTGVDHERQPATLPAQLRETRDLLTLGALMKPEEAARLNHSLLRYDEATAALSAIYRRANERSEHTLEGVERDVVGWRLTAQNAAHGEPIVSLRVTERIHDFAELVHVTGSMGFLWGPTGSGKTKALEAHVNRVAMGGKRRVIKVDMTDGGNKVEFLDACLAAVGSSTRSHGDKKRAFMAHLNGQTELIIDEFHQTWVTGTLKINTVEMIRRWHDQTGCSVLLVCTDTLEETLRDRRFAKVLAQTAGRGPWRRRIPTMPLKADIATVAAAYQLTPLTPNTDAARIVHELCAEAGLRRLCRHLQASRILATNKGQVFGWTHVVETYANLLAWAAGTEEEGD